MSAKLKTYKVTASQLVYYTKVIEAESEEQAEELAWEYDSGNGWQEFDYGEWQLEKIELNEGENK